MEKAGKILAIFLLIFFFFVIFLAAASNKAFSSDYKRNYFKTENESPFRGTIVTKDGIILAQSARNYQLIFDGRHAEADKKPIIAKMIALYIGARSGDIAELLEKNSRVVLAKDLTTQEAKNLTHLSRELDKLGAFKTVMQNGGAFRYGLEISQMHPNARNYPFKTLAQPFIGYVQKQSGDGEMGLEKYYEEQLASSAAGYTKSKRDAGGNLIYSGLLEHKSVKNGLSLQLTIDSKLQSALENLVDTEQASREALEVIVAVMESKSGKILSIATSNRFNAEAITEASLPNTKINAVQYAFEPGSVMKPFITALLFEEGLVGQYDLVNGHNGRYKIGSDTITDVVPKQWLSVEDVLIFSSNIGVAQLALNLSPYKIYDGLTSFGFAKNSGIDLPYEAVGELPGLNRYRSDIYRATTAYGYGLRVSFMQLMKAYNAFNNGGVVVAPHLLEKVDGDSLIALEGAPSLQVISNATAIKTLQILRKVVTKGTGKNANVDGIFVAGKSGTAHIARAGSYKDDYHSSFFGFANDQNSSYTIGVLFIDPKKGHLSGIVSAPTFKKTVELLIDHNFLTRENHDTPSNNHN